MVPTLIGTYSPPALRVGAITHCLYRDADVRITSITDAPIPWPRCNAIGVQGGSGLLVNGDLRRAIETESAEALMHWWGVSTKAVWRWRKAFGVTQFGTEGSRRLHAAASAKGADATKTNGISDAECNARSKRAKKLKLIEYARANRWPLKRHE